MTAADAIEAYLAGRVKSLDAAFGLESEAKAKRGPREDEVLNLEIVVAYLLEGCKVRPGALSGAWLTVDKSALDDQPPRGTEAKLARRFGVARSHVGRTIARWRSDEGLLSTARAESLRRLLADLSAE